MTRILFTPAAPIDADDVAFEILAVVLMRFDPPNSVESHRIKARTAKDSIVHRQPIKVWRGPCRVEVRQ